MSLRERCCKITVLCAAAKALAAKHKKPVFSKKILIPQSDQEDSTQDSVCEGIINVRHTFFNVLLMQPVLPSAVCALLNLLLLWIIFRCCCCCCCDSPMALLFSPVTVSCPGWGSLQLQVGCPILWFASDDLGSWTDVLPSSGRTGQWISKQDWSWWDGNHGVKEDMKSFSLSWEDAWARLGTNGKSKSMGPPANLIIFIIFIMKIVHKVH